jgi:hypothetical protein
MIHESNEIAQAKARKALDKIEAAQGLLADACAELSSLKWAFREWKKVGDHYDKTKALWHKVNNSLAWNKLELDNWNERKAKLLNDG